MDRWCLTVLAVVWVPLSGCDAYDLGDESPIAIAVDPDNPTWDGGVRELVTAKCVNCHTASPSGFVPSHVPPVLHANGQDMTSEVFFTANIRSQALPANVYVRTYLDTDAPMPPNYATPMNAEESAALKRYLENLGLAPQQLCPDDAGLGLAYADVQSTLAESCATCHAQGAAGRVPLDTETVVRRWRYSSIVYTATGYMPFQSSTTEDVFLETTAGQQLMQWLCYGADLDPMPSL